MLDGRINNRGTGGFHNYPKAEAKKQCESCGIIEHGSIYNEFLSKYRGRMICSWCTIKWRRLGRSVEFEEFKSGIKTQPYYAKRYEEIKKQAQEGKTTQELMATFGVSRSTIKRALS